MPASSLSRHSLLRSFDSAFSDLYTPCVVFGDWKGLAENRTSWVSVALGYVGAVGYCPSFRSSLFRFRLLPRLRLVHICGEGCTFTFSRLQSRRLWEGCMEGRADVSIRLCMVMLVGQQEHWK